MKQFTSKTQKIGALGEKICKKFLMKHDFHIIEQNYTQSFGEIDIIAEKNNVIHFIEVKSIQNKNVSYETKSNNVSRETKSKEEKVSYETKYNPAENFTHDKYKKVLQTALFFLENDKNKKERHKKWQIDLYLVYIDPQNIKHKIKRIENVIFS